MPGAGTAFRPSIGTATDREQAIRAPAPYLRASAERVVPARCGDEFMVLARQGTLVEVEGPHLLLQSNPHAAARHIRAFVQAHVPQVPASP